MSETPRGPVEYRTAQPVGLSWPKRTIDLVVMPYETEALVDYNGRPIVEVCSRGAWDGLEGRPNRVKVNRDHDVRRTVGKAIAFHPSRQEGLVAELRVSQTPLGDETLALAEDGCLDASAGFTVMVDRETGKLGEVWESRDRRRLTRCWLAHIAMTPDPAYEAARVLAVRHTEVPVAVSATPILDRLLAERLREQYGPDL